MKKLLVFAAGLLIIGLMSCAEDCKECFIRTTGPDGATIENETTPEEYCGDNLVEKEDSEPDVDVSDVKTEWICE